MSTQQTMGLLVAAPGLPALSHSAALVYCRVSTKGQEQDGTSLESQEQRTIAHAQALG